MTTEPTWNTEHSIETSASPEVPTLLAALVALATGASS